MQNHSLKSLGKFGVCARSYVYQIGCFYLVIKITYEIALLSHGRANTKFSFQFFFEKQTFS